MGKKGVTKIQGTQTNQILANPTLYQAFGVQVGSDGVEADASGRKIIPAGTPVGGETKTFDNEKAVLVVTNDAGNAAKTQGVLLFDVDVTYGTENGTLLVFGFVNENRLDKKLTIVNEVKEALDGKVTFVKRN